MSSSSHMEKGSQTADTGMEHPLPETYGNTEASLLPRDPNWMFIYWDISENSKKNISREHGQDVFEKSKHVIRVHDITGIDGFNGSNSNKYFDIPIMLNARNWYINVQESGKSYCCEIGLVLSDGRFISIVTTNVVTLPSGRVSDITDEKWMAVSSDFDKLLQLSGVEYIGRGSGEVAKSLAQRWEMLRAVFSRAASWGISSISSQIKERPRERKFWLLADCELILYGATEPDALVTIAGKKIALNPDGTFSMRFAFPDGNIVLPVKAVSRDEVDTRIIEIQTSRSTKTDDK